MDIETMPHTMYFSSNKETITEINQVPYQVIDYDDKGMFQAKLMDNTQVEIFLDNGVTPSILETMKTYLHCAYEILPFSLFSMKLGVINSSLIVCFTMV